MPPVVTGAVVAVIGLNLAPIAVKGIAGNAPDTWIGDRDRRRVGCVAVRARDCSGGCRSCWAPSRATRCTRASRTAPGLGKPIDFAPVAAARDRRAALYVTGVGRTAMALIAPVAIVLVAENLGHVKAVAAMTGENPIAYLGAHSWRRHRDHDRGMGGGTGVTTYAENIGVMAVTKIYSTLVFVVAALAAIALGFARNSAR